MALITKIFDWKVMPEAGRPGLWSLPDSLEDEANESPLENWPGALFGSVVHVSLFR